MSETEHWQLYDSSVAFVTDAWQTTFRQPGTKRR